MFPRTQPWGQFRPDSAGAGRHTGRTSSLRQVRASRPQVSFGGAGVQVSVVASTTHVRQVGPIRLRGKDRLPGSVAGREVDLGAVAHTVYLLFHAIQEFQAGLEVALPSVAPHDYAPEHSSTERPSYWRWSSPLRRSHRTATGSTGSCRPTGRRTLRLLHITTIPRSSPPWSCRLAGPWVLRLVDSAAIPRCTPPRSCWQIRGRPPAATAQLGRSLEHASEELRAGASLEFQADREVDLATAARHGYARKLAPPGVAGRPGCCPRGSNTAWLCPDARLQGAAGKPEGGPRGGGTGLLGDGPSRRDGHTELPRALPGFLLAAADREVDLAAVAHGNFIREPASLESQAGRALAFAAVAQRGYAPMHASKEPLQTRGWPLRRRRGSAFPWSAPLRSCGLALTGSCGPTGRCTSRLRLGAAIPGKSPLQDSQAYQVVALVAAMQRRGALLANQKVALAAAARRCLSWERPSEDLRADRVTQPLYPGTRLRGPAGRPEVALAAAAQHGFDLEHASQGCALAGRPSAALPLSTPPRTCGQTGPRSGSTVAQALQYAFRTSRPTRGSCPRRSCAPTGNTCSRRLHRMST